MISWAKASSNQCGMARTSSTVASEKGHTPSLTLMDNSWRTPAMGSTSRNFTLNITNESLHFLFSCFTTFFSRNQGQHHQFLVQSHSKFVRETSHISGLKLLSPYETIISCLINKFQDHFLGVTSIYEPWHDDVSVYKHVLVSHFSTTTHAGYRATAH